MQQALISFFPVDTFKRFPHLKPGILGVGAGWIGAILDRLGAFTHSMNAKRESVTELFQRHCIISGDPGETAAPCHRSRRCGVF